MPSSRFTDIESGYKSLPPIYGIQKQPLVPLEKAVEPVIRQIKDLMHYVKKAKDDCYFPCEHGLTKDESAAIYLYTMEWNQSLYIVLNTALRSEDRSCLKPWFSYLKLFLTAIDRLPSSKQNLWRGIDKNISSTYKKGEEITWWSISSCSEDVEIIKGFLKQNGNNTLFMIEANNGKLISKYSSFKNEKEILLAPPTKLHVVSNSLHHQGLDVVHLREVINNQPINNPMPPIPIHSPSMIEKLMSFCSNYGSRLRGSLFLICIGLGFYPLAVRLRDIGFYARLSAASPYGPVPISYPARLAIKLGPVLERAGFISSFLSICGLLIGYQNCL